MNYENSYMQIGKIADKMEMHSLTHFSIQLGAYLSSKAVAILLLTAFYHWNLFCH